MVSPTIQTYFSKMKGQRYDPKKLKSPPKPPTRIQVLVSSFVGSFVGIAIVASLSYNAQWFVDRNTPVLAGSFGASAVLIYGAIEAPLSQPRNVIGGHIMSSFIGVSLYKLFNLMSQEAFDRLHWLLCSLSVSISLFVMQLTHTVHPPASATALIAVTGGQAIYDLGYWYMLCPIALGVALMMIVAMLVNNVVRTYPSHWWAPKSRMITVVDQDMSTTLADFVSPEDDDEEDEDAVENKQGDLTTVATTTSTGNNNKSSLTHQPTISSSSSLTFSPNLKDSATTAVADQPITSVASSPRPVTSTHSHANSHSHPHGQYAVYYGGDRREELKDGEKLLERHAHNSSPIKDIEHGSSQTHGSKRHSILIGLRGSPHPSHATTTSSGATPSHVATATEEEYRATIEQLHQRIQELESRLAASVTTPVAVDSTSN
ncbi:MAG: HPP family-domain-containing protein [Linnemannia gamsii]|nr:MAG: HPP family-domain-containing protein [Linnemannia gamsii]